MIAAALALFSPCVFSQETQKSAAVFPGADSLFERISSGSGGFLLRPFAAFEAEPFALTPDADLTPLAAESRTVRPLAAAPVLDSPAQAKGGIPPWLKSLRRAEIVAFGSLPLTIFWTSTFMDLYRASNHNWDSRYLPWPAKGPNAVEMDYTEMVWMFTIAGGTSLLIAIIDFCIVQYKRSRHRSNAAVMRTIPKKEAEGSEPGAPSE